ncbi:MAG: hypothetical protein ACTSQY_01020 [Candidatus Odinarchaeia archaeon]
MAADNEVPLATLSIKFKAEDEKKLKKALKDVAKDIDLVNTKITKSGTQTNKTGRRITGALLSTMFLVRSLSMSFSQITNRVIEQSGALEYFTTVLEDIVRPVLQPFIDMFYDLTDELDNSNEGFKSIVGVIFVFGWALATILAVLIPFLLVLMGVDAIMKSALVMKFFALASGVIATIAPFLILLAAFTAFWLLLEDFTWDNFFWGLKELAKPLTDPINKLGKKIHKILEMTYWRARKFFRLVGRATSTYLSSVGSNTKTKLKNIYKFLTTVGKKVIKKAKTIFKKLKKLIKSFFKDVKEKGLKVALQNIYKKLKSFIKKLKTKIEKWIKPITDSIKNIWKKIFPSKKEEKDLDKADVKEKKGGIRSLISNLLSKFGKVLGGEQYGGFIPITGLYKLHAGERVVNNHYYNTQRIDMNNNVASHMDISKIAYELERYWGSRFRGLGRTGEWR